MRAPRPAAQVVDLRERPVGRDVEHEHLDGACATTVALRVRRGSSVAELPDRRPGTDDQLVVDELHLRLALEEEERLGAALALLAEHAARVEVEQGAAGRQPTSRRSAGTRAPRGDGRLIDPAKAHDPGCHRQDRKRSDCPYLMTDGGHRPGPQAPAYSPAMELAEALRTNPSIREFTDEPVDDATVAELLELARFAPSGGNRQPGTWR